MTAPQPVATSRRALSWQRMECWRLKGMERNEAGRAEQREAPMRNGGAMSEAASRTWGTAVRMTSEQQAL